MQSTFVKNTNEYHQTIIPKSGHKMDLYVHFHVTKKKFTLLDHKALLVPRQIQTHFQKLKMPNGPQH